MNVMFLGSPNLYWESFCEIQHASGAFTTTQNFIRVCIVLAPLALFVLPSHVIYVKIINVNKASDTIDELYLLGNNHKTCNLWNEVRNEKETEIQPAFCEVRYSHEREFT